MNVLGTFPEGSLGTNQKRTKNEPSPIYERPTFWERSQKVRWERTKRERKTNQVLLERPTFWERSQKVRWERTKIERKTNQSHMRDQRSQNVPRRFVENEPWENQKRTFVERSVLAGTAQLEFGVGHHSAKADLCLSDIFISLGYGVN